MALALQNNDDPSMLDSISKLSDLFLPKSTTTTGGTTKQQTVISPAAAQHLINTMLGGTQGLASVAGAQKGAGLYNSSTNQLLVDDLLSRTAGEIAARGAPTFTTAPDRIVTIAPPANPLKTLLGTGAMYLGNKVLKSSGISDKVDSGINSIVKGVMGAGSVGGGVNAAGGVSLAGRAGTGLNAGAGVNASKFGLSGGSVSGGGMVMDNAGSLIDNYDEYSSLTEGSEATSYALDSGTAISGGAEMAEGAGAAGGGVDLGGGSIGTGFSIGANLAQENYGGAAGNAIGFMVGNAIVPGIGGLVGSAIGGMMGDECFITTAVLTTLNTDNDNCDVLQTLRTFRDEWMQTRYPVDIKQYYQEAPDLAAKLVNLSNSKEVCMFLYLFFILPAVVAIQEGKEDDAYSIYKYMFNRVKEYLESQYSLIPGSK